MKCPQCDFENEEGAKFCSNCNEPLVAPKFYTKGNIERIIKKERLGMNIIQKIILAIFIPVILYVISLSIAEFIVNNFYWPDDLEKTWYVWFVFLITVCIFEYKLFEDKKKKDNK